jgi:hypothetical protein
MPAKRIVRHQLQQDFATRFAAARTDKQRTAAITAADPKELYEFLSAMSQEDLKKLVFEGNPERLALLRAKGIGFDMGLTATIIVGGDTKHHTGRRWGKSQWIQASFVDKNVLGYPLPPKANLEQLTERVNAWLKQQPDYHLGPVTRWAVSDALKKAREANASPREK